ncbi:ABC transporter ATP-binding protein [Arthrobacter sulfonylureivorans]|uniref:ABC transporter ATP-binding protein n=1 Tax=Arthrobacter sulfonylureivorans TaxID=2486855 RepID=A0ABY3WAX2_9MICC|nr:ABC transporter ATP-binding protein [Arthrobacter sulfonylureivorans]UNK46340.1 ABC transporter ATP-binding protein [Arthrobacter sulfonylureivorans]
MTLLEVENLDVHHGQLHAVRGFSLAVEPGATVAVIGANAAGKSTLMRAIAGSHLPTAGAIRLDGKDITRLPAHRRVAQGICLVPEGRRLFKSLSVQENLETGTYRAGTGPWNVNAVMELFPWMRERARQNSASLSGGQQQAVAIGRALVANPKVLLIDELSLGLAPAVVKQMYALLPRIVERGTAVLLVEQDVSQALAAADLVHCLLEGRTVLTGSPHDLTSAQVEQAYFGLAHAGGGPEGN